MNFKKFSKGLLAFALATTLALSAPMAVFANATTIGAEVAEKEWESFVKEVVGLFNGAASKADLVEELNNLEGADSQFKKLFDLLELKEKEVLDKYSLNLESLKTIVEIINENDKLELADLDASTLIEKLNAPHNKARIMAQLGLREVNLDQVKAKIGQFNAIRKVFKGAKKETYAFLSYKDGKFSTTEKLNIAIDLVKGMAGDNEILGLLTEERVKTFISGLNTDTDKAMKDNIWGVVQAYNIDAQAVTPTPPENNGGGTGGGASTSPSKEAQKDITASLADLAKKDAKVAGIIEKILKDISKLDAVGAKAVAGPIIAGMMDIIKKAETPANTNDAKDAIVTLVQALVSKVTTQDVEVKDGAVTLSASKVKEQLKDATDMIKQLTAAAEKNNVELTKTVKVTLSYELDKEVTDVAVSIPEGLWSAIDKKANIAVRAKGIELVLEHNTFAEQVYTINVAAQEGNIFELTTEATFVQPIAVTFAVDKAVKNYPTVFQVLEGKNEVIGGVFNAQAETIKAFLSHFSFYTVGQGEPKAFTDIRDLTWEKEAVQELSARGYIAGMSETSFAPRANITRAEFAAMLTRVVPNIEVPGKVGFTDVKQGAWYYNSIVTAVNQGWLVGRDNNKFDPAAPVTRQEVAAVLSRVLEQKGYLQTADDVEGLNVAPWAKDAVSLYLREVETKEVLALDMKDDATRAEVAVMIYELLSK